MRAKSPQTPSQAHLLPAHGSWVVPRAGPTGCPQPPGRRSIAAAVSKALPKELPVSIFLLTGHGGAEILPVSRNPAAAGERPRPAATVPRSRAALFGIPRKNNRSYFRLYGSGESPRPSAGSKDTAASQGLASPRDPRRGGVSEGTRSVPSAPLQGRGDDGACAVGWVQLFGDAGASWQRAGLEEIWWPQGQANGSPGGTGQSHTRRGASRSLRPWGQGTLCHLPAIRLSPPEHPQTCKNWGKRPLCPPPQKDPLRCPPGGATQGGHSCHAARATALSDFARFLLAQHLKTAVLRPAAVPSPLLCATLK